MIYFDVSTLNPEKITGVGVYMQQLLKQFHEKKIAVQPVIKLSRWKKKAALARVLPQKECRLMLPFSFFGSQDIYHGPDFKLSTQGNFPRIVTVHDMVVFEQKYNAPEFYQKGIAALTKTLNSKKLDAVIVNSEFTKNEVLKHFPHLASRIHVTYLGCERKEAGTKTDLNLPAKYVLYLGTLEKRKNVLGVIKAFEKLKSQGFEHKLVLAGKPGFGYSEIEAAIQDSEFKKDILKINYVSDAGLPRLYAHAELFLFPSFYEGFGIPVLEAMALGCPVVTSLGGAVQEVCGNAALMASADDWDALAAHMVTIIQNPEARADLKRRGLERAAQFTWEKCALATVNVYQSLLAKKSS